jgi:hypothetical protein
MWKNFKGWRSLMKKNGLWYGKPGKGAVVLVSAAVMMLFVSCLGIEMDVKINSNGSGEVDMAFHISQIFFQLDPEQQDVPVPITREELESSYEGIEGVTVVNVSEEDTEEKKIITATLAFDSFEALSAGDEELFQGTTLTSSGGRSVYRAVLKEAVEADAEEEENVSGDAGQEEMVKQYFQGYNFIYRVRAPKKIQSHSIGTLSDGDKTLTFEMPMYDFNEMKNSEPLVLEVTW